MTSQEVHIDFQLKLQKVSSYTFGDYTPEEIDWIINQHMYRFVRNMISSKSNRKQEGFDDTQIRADLIESLKTQVALPLYYWDTNEQFAILPSNYLMRVNERLDIKFACNSITKSNTNTITKYVAVVEIPDPDGGTIYNNLVVNLLDGGTTAIYNGADFTSFLANILDKESNFYLVYHWFEQLNLNNDIEVYWEKYADIYEPNKFIVVTDNSSLTAVQVDVNGTLTNFSFTGKTFNTYITTDTTKPRQVEPRPTSSEKVYKFNRNPFRRTQVETPLITQLDGKIIVHEDDNFVSETLLLGYLRRPRLVNYYLNQSIELGSTLGLKSDICRMIIDRAVQTTAGRIMAGNYQPLVNETLFTE